MRRILVLRGGALGDLLVTLPALAALRARWPAARIELAGNAPAAALGVACGILDAAHSQHESRWSALFSPPPLPTALTVWLETFDLVLSFWPDPNAALARHFPRHPGQLFLSAAAHPACAPAAAHFCAPLRSLGLAPQNFFFPLRQWQPASRRIALHPGSGSPNKNWPLPHWRELCRWLPSAGFGIPAIISGEAEPDQLLHDYGTPWRNLPLATLADHLAQCRLFVGHDSGISHLAVACGVPCVLLFGPTDPTIWAPPRPQVRVIRRGHALDSISLPDLQREILSLLPAQT